ncbi:MAG: hypothetical protein A2Z04_00185 [Chloroflexi bacterium RBG_16_57_9]|nr:MAG: hypothetical protein A2Z04_00185 [Chloroflexi bacterium RBG_16_57_9]
MGGFVLTGHLQAVANHKLCGEFHHAAGEGVVSPCVEGVLQDFVPVLWVAVAGVGGGGYASPGGVVAAVVVDLDSEKLFDLLEDVHKIMGR